MLASDGAAGKAKRCGAKAAADGADDLDTDLGSFVFLGNTLGAYAGKCELGCGGCCTCA